LAPQATASTTGTPADGRVRRHIQILASLWLANGILRFAEVGSIFIAGQMLPFLMGWGIPGHAGNWPFNFLPFGLYSIGGLLAFFGVAYIVLAWGLFQRQPWARVLGLVLGILSLLRPPFGTALGIYTLWVLPARNTNGWRRLRSTLRGEFADGFGEGFGVLVDVGGGGGGAHQGHVVEWR
jgi:hypothetical protein